MKRITYSYKREKKQNPYIGFTSFQHFRNGPLYSDLVVLPENNMTETEHVECYPVPSYVKENGRDEGYYPDCSVAYIRILWKEFEPNEGEYNYAFIESILEKARENGQTVMLRLMQHSTRETDDVPNWLKEKIECPARPIGKRVKVCPSDPKFLTYFGRAVRALGERFDSDPTLAMVDISLPGAWGEGSYVELFTEEQLKNFVDIYSDAFRNTLLIGQIEAPWLVHYSCEKAPIGWRADCIGPEQSYERVTERRVKMPDVWKRGHISFESYWWLGEWKRKGWDPDLLFGRMLDMHVSTFNAKSLPIPFEWKEKVDAFVSKMGYHFTPRAAEMPKKASRGGTLAFSLTAENLGVAPIYHALPLCVRLKGDKRTVETQTDVDIRAWLPGERTENITLALPSDMEEGKYALEIGIGGKDLPSVCFATDAEQDEDFVVLSYITIER